jgi:hypothetical protein
MKYSIDIFNYGNEAKNKGYRYFVKSLYEMGFNPIALGIIGENANSTEWAKVYKQAYIENYFYTNNKGDVAKMHYYEGLSRLLIAYIANRNGKLFVA